MGRGTGEQPVLVGLSPAAMPPFERRRGRPLFEAIGQFLDQHRLDPMPSNYLLAYVLITRASPAAVAAVAAATSDGVRLSQRDADRILADTGLGRAGATIAPAPVDDILEQARRQLEAVEALVGNSHDHAASFERDLETSAAELRTSEAALEDLLRITADMIERTRQSERQLEETTHEVQSLRQELATMSEAARTDALTGLANRRALEDRFDWLQKSGIIFSAAICDVDRFKGVNDSHGHGVGDRVLKVVAGILQEASAGHFVGRYGGEEFVVLLGGVRAKAGAALMDEARRELAERHFRVRDTEKPLGKVTFSAGVVEGRPGESWYELIARADAMLYRAKESGRNRIEVQDGKTAP
ncbi:MAG TPA: diguanylate cyclase [Allosphingosinicella sp.]|jgi:diguanylate cyclase|nr:diguanylate cyclase [Allosphingosinicella sp.]